MLEDQAIREGVKVYANWPTIPQLYVRGEFIGGCDIMLEMHQSGELKTLLEGIAAPGDLISFACLVTGEPQWFAGAALASGSDLLP